MLSVCVMHKHLCKLYLRFKWWGSVRSRVGAIALMLSLALLPTHKQLHQASYLPSVFVRNVHVM